ncbi:MAG: hypothetical protein ACE5KF_04595 [Kiloniellaceae bacterium]
MPEPNAIAPGDFVRRSFVYRKLAAAGANFGEVAGAAVALDFGDPAGEATSARRMALADLSPLPRTGFKGAGTPEWLTGQGVLVPEQSNRAMRQPGGGLAARVAPGEVVILGDLAGAGGLPGRLLEAWAAEPVPPETPRGYPMPRGETHAWFLVTGAQAAAMFAKICGVDLRPGYFGQGRIAQTSVARLNAVIVRDDQGAVPAYHLLADCTSADYLWDCVLDAMAEFDGGPIGLTAVKGLSGG